MEPSAVLKIHLVFSVWGKLYDGFNGKSFMLYVKSVLKAGGLYSQIKRFCSTIRQNRTYYFQYPAMPSHSRLKPVIDRWMPSPGVHAPFVRQKPGGLQSVREYQSFLKKGVGL